MDILDELELFDCPLCHGAGLLVETVELSDLPFYIGVQYHPEFKSRPNKPHPLFLGFVEAALRHGGK